LFSTSAVKLIIERLKLQITAISHRDAKDIVMLDAAARIITDNLLHKIESPLFHRKCPLNCDHLTVIIATLWHILSAQAGNFSFGSASLMVNTWPAANWPTWAGINFRLSILLNPVYFAKGLSRQLFNSPPKWPANSGAISRDVSSFVRWPFNGSSVLHSTSQSVPQSRITIFRWNRQGSF